jgi:hypothetical protein
MTVRQFSGLIDEMQKVNQLEQGESHEQAITDPAARSAYFAKLVAKNRRKMNAVTG